MLSSPIIMCGFLSGEVIDLLEKGGAVEFSELARESSSAPNVEVFWGSGRTCGLSKRVLGVRRWSGESSDFAGLGASGLSGPPKVSI